MTFRSHDRVSYQPIRVGPSYLPLPQQSVYSTASLQTSGSRKTTKGQTTALSSRTWGGSQARPVKAFQSSENMAGMEDLSQECDLGEKAIPNIMLDWSVRGDQCQVMWWAGLGLGEPTSANQTANQ